MRLEVLKVYSHVDMDEEKRRLIEEYGSLENLAQKAATIGCTRPNYVDDYMTLKALSSKNPSVIERRTYTGTATFGFLTPRRMDLLDYLKNHEVESITRLSEALKRNYKNVYDDLRALEEIGMIIMVRRKNKKVPRLNMTEMRIAVDGGGE